MNEYTLTIGTVKGLISSGTQLYVSTGSNINKIGLSLATAVIETPESIGNFISTRVMYDTFDGTVGLKQRKMENRMYLRHLNQTQKEPPYLMGR